MRKLHTEASVHQGHRAARRALSEPSAVPYPYRAVALKAAGRVDTGCLWDARVLSTLVDVAARGLRVDPCLPEPSARDVTALNDSIVTGHGKQVKGRVTVDAAHFALFKIDLALGVGRENHTGAKAKLGIVGGKERVRVALGVSSLADQVPV